MEDSQALRVLVAYGRHAERVAAAALLGAAGMDVAMCTTAVEAIETATAARADVCVLDVALPESVSAAELIAAVAPSVGVVLVADEVTEDGLADAFRAGAHGYIEKSVDTARLAATVRAVAAGQAMYPQPLMQRLLANLAA